jgi:hypothetical protein
MRSGEMSGYIEDETGLNDLIPIVALIDRYTKLAVRFLLRVKTLKIK